MLRKHIALTIVVGLALVIACWQRLPLRWTPMQTAGLCLLIPGFILWTLARLQLGASFAITAQARQLVSSGIYSKIRNPIYIFGSCVVAGFILLIGRAPWLLVFLVIIPLQIWRARKEASVLEAKFGEQYRAYRASTWF
jgi:protein-S-isoprenylcysteine O-methyltransferase Ste14